MARISPRFDPISAGLFVALTLAAQQASAYHTPRKHITDDTAYTLRDGEIRVGIWKVQYGILDQLSVGTYVFPWLILAPNAHVKWRFFRNERLALAFATGALYADTELLNWVEQQLGPAQVLAIPFELLGSYRFDDRFTFSLGPLWTLVRVKGRLDEDAYDGVAEGAGDNFQTQGTFEWRISRVTALTFQGRYVFLQRESLSANIVSTPDAFTTIEAVAVGQQAYQFSGAFSIAVDAVLSWEVFNLRAGLGFGNYYIPAVNWVIPEKRLVPRLDIYYVWR